MAAKSFHMTSKRGKDSRLNPIRADVKESIEKQRAPGGTGCSPNHTFGMKGGKSENKHSGVR